MPVHGSPDVPLRILHDWHAKLVAAQMDYLLTNSALTVASAIKEAADAGAKAAKAREDAAAMTSRHLRHQRSLARTRRHG